MTLTVLTANSVGWEKDPPTTKDQRPTTCRLVLLLFRAKKITSASTLNTVRTACSLPHFINSLRAPSEFRSSNGSRSFLLVGRIAIKVKGTTAPMRIPPTSHAPIEFNHHAQVAATSPITASDACITVARR